MLKLNDAGVENRWIEREEKLCVVSIKAVVQGEWWNKRTERGSVQDKQHNTNNTCTHFDAVSLRIYYLLTYYFNFWFIL